MVEPIRKKSQWFHKHGKHPSVLPQVRREEQERQKRKQFRTGKMFQSVIEAIRRS